MIMVNIYEAKAKLSEFLEAASKGERVVICKHNQPVAELRAIEAVTNGPRDLTPMYPGATFTTQAFFEPLSADEMRAWEGSDGSVPKVAEKRGTSAPRGGRRRPRKPRR
jgi:antitoxin (DNA-binding transcriptional repressor) of toxin-antitoxin stability system